MGLDYCGKTSGTSLDDAIRHTCDRAKWPPILGLHTEDMATPWC
jgi:hypothetical protein